MRLIGFKRDLWIMMALCALSLPFLISCDVHQFPEPKEEPGGPGNPSDPDDPNQPDEPVIPDDPDKYVDLGVHVIYNTPMYLWEHYYDPKTGTIEEQYPDANVDGFHPATTQRFEGKLDNGFKNIKAKFYLKGSTSYVARQEEFISSLSQDYDQDLSIRMMPGEYDLVVWSDFRLKEDDSPFYDSSDFGNIQVDYDQYKANTDHKDTFRGRTSVQLGEESQDIVVELYRPMAKYEFITTDLSEFLDKETERRNLSTRASIDDYTVMIHYSTYHPSTYNAFEDWLTNSKTGVSFVTEVTVNGESEASLGFDYVLINDTSDTGVQATIVVYDKEGNNVAQSVQITIPLRRDHHTLLRGAFLTMNGSGGVGIDPGYNGDHNVFP